MYRDGDAMREAEAQLPTLAGGMVGQGKQLGGLAGDFLDSVRAA
jgi:hypothetical protein